MIKPIKTLHGIIKKPCKVAQNYKKLFGFQIFKEILFFGALPNPGINTPDKVGVSKKQTPFNNIIHIVILMNPVIMPVIIDSATKILRDNFMSLMRVVGPMGSYLIGKRNNSFICQFVPEQRKQIIRHQLFSFNPSIVRFLMNRLYQLQRISVY